MKSITLNAATRRICSALLNRVGKSDPDSARNVREIRRRFELAAFDKVCDRLTDQLRVLLNQNLTWRELLDMQSLLDDLAEVDDGTEATEKSLGKARGRIERISGSSEFTMDDSLLKWLQALCTTVNWNKVRVQTQMGISEAEVDVSSEQLEAFADFVDAVNGAIASAGLNKSD